MNPVIRGGGKATRKKQTGGQAAPNAPSISLDEHIQKLLDHVNAKDPKNSNAPSITAAYLDVRGVILGLEKQMKELQSIENPGSVNTTKTKIANTLSLLKNL